MEKLKDILGTKYLTIDYVGKFQQVLESRSELDLADCKLNPACEVIMRKFYGKVKFINSSNEVLNDILVHNQKAVEDRTCLNAISLPIAVNSQDEILQFFHDIDKTRIYSLENCKVNRLKCLSLAILLTMKFPEVVIDMREFAKDLYQSVRIDWLPCRELHDKYTEVIGMAVIEREVVNGKVFIPGEGLIDEELFVYTHNALPSLFGTTKLARNPEFKEVWDSALQNLVSSLDSIKTMKDYIEVI